MVCINSSVEIALLSDEAAHLSHYDRCCGLDLVNIHAVSSLQVPSYQGCFSGDVWLWYAMVVGWLNQSDKQRSVEA